MAANPWTRHGCIAYGELPLKSIFFNLLRTSLSVWMKVLSCGDRSCCTTRTLRFLQGTRIVKSADPKANWQTPTDGAVYSDVILFKGIQIAYRGHKVLTRTVTCRKLTWSQPLVVCKLRTRRIQTSYNCWHVKNLSERYLWLIPLLNLVRRCLRCVRLAMWSTRLDRKKARPHMLTNTLYIKASIPYAGQSIMDILCRIFWIDSTQIESLVLLRPGLKKYQNLREKVEGSGNYLAGRYGWDIL